MIDYINDRIKELNNTFNDYPVVLVEILSANSELKGKMFAITEETAGFPSFKDAINIYNLKQDTTMAIGITAQCLNAMTEIENNSVQCFSIDPKPFEHCKQNYNQTDMPPAQFYGLLVLFLLFVIFIVGCFEKRK